MEGDSGERWGCGPKSEKVHGLFYAKLHARHYRKFGLGEHEMRKGGGTITSGERAGRKIRNRTVPNENSKGW